MITDRVAVLVPTYNRAEFLTEALASIGEGTYPADIIVYDDASQDEDVTQSVLADLYGRGLIADYLTGSENKGVAHARNQLLQHAMLLGYKYMAWQDSDDISHPERLARQMARLKADNADVCFSNMYFFTHPRHYQKTRTVNRIDVTKYTSREGLYNNTNFATALFTRKAAALRFDEALPRREDVDWLTKLIEKGIKFTNEPEPLYYCRRHPGRLTYRKDLQWSLFV